MASEAIGDPFHHAQALAEISEAQAAAGDNSAARANLDRARGLLSEIDGEALQAWALHDIGLAYVKAGDLAAAEAMAESIHDPRLHDIVLAAVVDAKRAARDMDGAQATARRMRDAARQGQSLRTIAIRQATEGDLSGALATARSIQHARANALALGDVAGALAREGGIGEARSLIARIRDTESRSRALVEVAAAQAGAGDIKGALGTTEEVEDKLARAQALARIAASGSAVPVPERQRMFSQSLTLVASARAAVNRKSDALVEIARAQLVTGDDEAAQAILQRVLADIDKVKPNSERLNLLGRIAPLQARAQNFAEAVATAMRVEDASLRPLLVRDIATSQAEKGDVAGALALARGLDDRAAAAAAMFGVLRVQSRAGDVSGLRETLGATLQAVRFIGSAELRAGALGSLAAANAQEGNVEAAEAAFKEAMSTAAAAESGQQRAAVYARIADSLADRHRPFAD
jgi:tetratricopeptide (TPR) repeat protein